MADTNGFLARYLARNWRTVPLHRPDPNTRQCSCGKPNCAKPGKHPDGRYWPEGSANPAHFVDHNLGVRLGPDSKNLADVDKDCAEAIAIGPFLLPATDSAFGRGGQETHSLYIVTDQAASFLKLQDPVLSGDEATIIELRWPEWDEDENRFKAIQTVFPPSLHVSGQTLEWIRDGNPATVTGADLVATVRTVAAAVLITRYAKPKERHVLVLLVANLLVRAGWTDDTKIVRFTTAVFTARNDPDKVKKIADGEGLGAVKDARKRLKAGKPMMGLPALREMLDPAIDNSTTEKVVAKVKEWLNVPDPPKAKPTAGTGPAGGKPPTPHRYTPLPPWQPFPTEQLPSAVREFVLTVSQAMRCDPTFVALPALAVCAGMIGGTRQIRLKKSWHEPAVTWAVVVGESGTLKTPPYKRAVAPVIAMQAAYLKEHRAAAETYRAELREYERKKRRVKDDDPGDLPVEPKCTRIYSRDTTVEALAGLLVDNKNRFLIGRDELSGWLASFNQYKAKGGSDLANWLELHSLGTLCVDRKTGEVRTIFVHGVGVSLCGGIQPGVLRAALSPQHFNAGIPARLLFAYPPRKPKEWTEDDIDEAVEANYHRLVKGLADLEPHTDEDGEPYPVTLGMTPEAKAEWVRFYSRFADKQAETEGELAAAFSKLEGYAARLALVHHLCRSVEFGSDGLEAVGIESIRAGIALAEWFTYEAERVYQMLGEETEEEETRKLMEIVTRLADRFGGRVTVKQLQRSNQRRYRTAGMAEEALESLVALGLGRWEMGETTGQGGRPSWFFVPCVTCDETDETPQPNDRDDPPEGGQNGDETDNSVTEPPGDGNGPNGETATDSSSSDMRQSDGCEVSSVSSHVTHGVGAQQQSPPPSQSASESFVTQDQVWSHTSDPFSTKGTGWRLVSDASGLGEAIQAIRCAERVGLDTETTGLNPARDRVRLLSLSTHAGTFLIDLFAFPDPTAGLAPLFAVLAEKEVVGHNIVAFDLPFLSRLGFSPARVFDTAIASRVAYAGEKQDHDLAAVVQRELDHTLGKDEQESDWSRPVLTPAQLAYAASDAEVLLPLADALREKAVARKVEAVLNLEMRCAVPVARMAARGVGFDAEAWNPLADTAASRRDALAAEMDALVPNPCCLPGLDGWNWNSTSDVTKAFAQVGLTIADTTEETLAGIDHPLACSVLEYREAAKRVGTYGREWVAEHVTEGRVYATWNLCQAKTGRMSCKQPNLQQVPRDLAYRRCFVARPGHVLVKCDFSQIELRIAAKVTGDARMLDAYQCGEDLHTLTAARFLGVGVNEVTKEARQMAKPVNFGAIYGLGPKSLRVKAKADYGKDMTEEQARGFLDAFFKQFPGVRAWHNRLKCEKATEVRTLGGRRIAVEADQFHGAKANYVIQGCLQPQVRVLTDHGYLPIGQLYSSATPTMNVWTGTRWAPFTVRNMGPCQFAQIAFQDGTILDCDIRHQLLVVTDSGYQWRGYAELQTGDRVATPLARAMDFTPPNPVGDCDGVPIDDEFWYWIGYYYGNGWIGRKRGELMFAFGPQPHRLAERSACEAYWRGRGVNAVSRDQPRSDRPGEFAYTLTICRAALIRALGRIGIGGGDAHTKRFPTRIFAETLANRIAFTRGFLAADGYLRGPRQSNPSVHLCQREMLADLKLMLRTLGVESNLRGPYFSKGRVSYRLDLHRRMYEEVFDPRQSNWPRLHGMDTPRFVVEELLSRYGDVPARAFPTQSARTLYRRLQTGGSVSVYTLERLCRAMGWVLDTPLYGVRNVMWKRELPVVEDTFTLSVDDPLHRFDSEGVISKNTGGDGLKRALVLLWERRAECPNAEVVLAVHDEIVVECPEAQQEETAIWLRAAMRDGMAPLIDPVPVEVEVSAGRTWGG